MKYMREFCLILIFEESENKAGDKFLVRIYTSNWNCTYLIYKFSHSNFKFGNSTAFFATFAK